ncbi:hypothetical protein F511_01179 [Dorcoceras hygrometricum]|uniref:Uncharacterized protein n=1 Tax=Dorcoceras hygrometricum TaxID=472368 RepID=A0A2Z7C261_9LAMI|nr:hypothetical protein F511_01179 [Dorcoceras hygrometricum]
MVIMFKTLETTGLKGFLTETGSVYEAAVSEFFANAKVITGMIVTSVANSKSALSKEMFAETFWLPNEGMVGFLDIPKETMSEIRSLFSGSDVPFHEPNKKKEMMIEFCLFHDIVSKCAKVGSFDMVTSKNFDLMVAISVGLEADLGESVKLHPQKVLTASKLRIHASNTEGEESRIAQQVVEKEKAASKKNKGEIAETDKKKKKLVNKMVPSQTRRLEAKMLQLILSGLVLTTDKHMRKLSKSG